MAVESAGPYASLHLAPDMPAPRATQFLQAECPLWRPTNSVKALKAHDTFHKLEQNFVKLLKCDKYYIQDSYDHRSKMAAGFAYRI